MCRNQYTPSTSLRELHRELAVDGKEHCYPATNVYALLLFRSNTDIISLRQFIKSYPYSAHICTNKPDVSLTLPSQHSHIHTPLQQRRAWPELSIIIHPEGDIEVHGAVLPSLRHGSQQLAVFHLAQPGPSRVQDLSSRLGDELFQQRHVPVVEHQVLVSARRTRVAGAQHSATHAGASRLARRDVALVVATVAAPHGIGAVGGAVGGALQVGDAGLHRHRVAAVLVERTQLRLWLGARRVGEDGGGAAQPSSQRRTDCPAQRRARRPQHRLHRCRAGLQQVTPDRTGSD